MKAEMGPREMAPSSATAFAKGHEFTRAVKACHHRRASAPERSGGLRPGDAGRRGARMKVVVAGASGFIGSRLVALLSAMGTFSLLSYKRRYRGYLWFAGVVLIAITQWSCANKSSGATNGNAGTATGTYTVTVSGTSGSTSGTPASVFFNLQ